MRCIHWSQGSIRTFGILFWMAVSLGWVASLEAQPIGFAHSSSRLYELSLTEVGDLPWSATPTSTGGYTFAVAFAADDVLYAIARSGVDELATIDSSTGVFDFIGPITPSGNDLAVGDDGRLWMIGGGSLYGVDTNDASTLEVPLVDPNLSAIAFHQGTLYGIRSVSDPEGWTFDFVSIDPDLATYSVVSELTGYRFEDCYAEFPWAMDFDRHGGLWVVVAEYNATCILPSPSTGYFYYEDPSVGIPGPKRRRAEGAPIFLAGLAIRDRAPVVEVPTLKVWGLGILGCLLALGSWRRLSIARH
ncbi:MAG: hypothetical protein K8J08_04105 [Thermoanaerobaculia bacterium]|nr:hypothetical protein [Thermoanaerobaculia bacterium]